MKGERQVEEEEEGEQEEGKGTCHQPSSTAQHSPLC